MFCTLSWYEFVFEMNKNTVWFTTLRFQITWYIFVLHLSPLACCKLMFLFLFSERFLVLCIWPSVISMDFRGVGGGDHEVEASNWSTEYKGLFKGTLLRWVLITGNSRCLCWQDPSIKTEVQALSVGLEWVFYLSHYLVLFCGILPGHGRYRLYYENLLKTYFGDKPDFFCNSILPSVRTETASLEKEWTILGQCVLHVLMCLLGHTWFRWLAHLQAPVVFMRGLF